MPAFVECGSAGQNLDELPVEDGRVEWSELLASGATTAQTAQSGHFFMVTATEDGYVAIGKTPDSSVNPRRRVLAGVLRSFAAQSGDKLAFTAG